MKLALRMAALRRNPLLTQKQAAMLLGVSWWTVAEWRRTGRLRGIRLGFRTVRIRKSDVEKLIQEATC